MAAGYAVDAGGPVWVWDNLREAIARLVDLGYSVRGGQGEDPEIA